MAAKTTGSVRKIVEFDGETWRALASQGVHAARLVHEGVQVTPTLSIPAA